MGEAERLVDRRGVAAMFSCSPASVDRLEAQGIIPPRRRLSGGRVGWLYSELVKVLRALPTGPLTARTAAARAARRNTAA
jgi:predicted DNA-binding transcriptional regulator AlpA